MNEPAEPIPSNMANTAGELISADIDCDQILVVNKDEKTKFPMYKTIQEFSSKETTLLESRKSLNLKPINFNIC